MKREVVARIRLDALRHNLRIARRLCPHSRIIAMVKANAYGHGLVPVAKSLGDADALGVAVIEEAMALRGAGIGKPVVILEGVFSAQELRLAADESFAVVVHQPEQVAMLAHTSLSRPLDVWLKLETGMHRLGLPHDAAVAAVAQLRPRVKSLGAMTHFACADEAGNAMTRVQLEQLQSFARAHHLPATAANSGAIVAMAASHLDAVRPGIMLYGGSPLAGKAAFEFDLQPVMTLNAQVIAVNAVPQGESVGYGATWHAPRDSRIAVVGIGYGDGYPRHAMPGTPVRIGKHLVPLVGRVSMDMITVDVTAHPEIAVGDEAVLWGEDLPADTVARHANTISYELFCRLTPRVRFEYAH
jgi:alanine racemase